MPNMNAASETEPSSSDSPDHVDEALREKHRKMIDDFMDDLINSDRLPRWPLTGAEILAQRALRRPPPRLTPEEGERLARATEEIRSIYNRPTVPTAIYE